MRATGQLLQRGASPAPTADNVRPSAHERGSITCVNYLGRTVEDREEWARSSNLARAHVLALLPDARSNEDRRK